MASVSAAVFATRTQGSDGQFAAFMAKVAKVDLSDFKLCISKAYAVGSLAVGDAKELVEVFRSPGGQRVLELSQQMLIADLRRGYHKPLDPSYFTPSDRQNVARIYKMPVFQRYGAFITSPAFKSATRGCVASSAIGRESGVKF